MCPKLGLAVVFVSLSPYVATGDDVETTRNQPTPFGSRILAITDVVLQNHIDPPTRQEMILAGIKALYHADNRPTPKGLSQRISDLAGPEHIAEFLDAVRAEFNTRKNVEVVLTNGMFDAVPGGASLMDAKTSRVNGQIAANRYVGVGIALRMSGDKKLPEIMKVLHNGPAWHAGVKSADIILKIDGESTASKQLNQIVEELRGEDGSEITIVVRQPDSEPREITMRRGRVFIPTVEGYQEKGEGTWQYTIDSAEEIAFIRIKSIGPSTLHELRRVEARLRGHDIQGIVLDLRVGGGLLHDTIVIADRLLDGGVIGHIRSLDSERKHEARPGALFQNIPMAVLVAEQTSSGQVFLTAALQDHQRAVVVGKPTIGETYVNSLIRVPDRNEMMRLATGIMLRGDRTPLLVPRSRRSRTANHSSAVEATQGNRPGFIMPDHVVAANVEGGHPAKDPILAKAIEVLRSAEAQTASRKDGRDLSG